MAKYHIYNNNAKIIGGYYLESVREYGGCARIVRGDCGTENVVVRDFQNFLDEVPKENWQSQLTSTVLARQANVSLSAQCSLC